MAFLTIPFSFYGANIRPNDIVSGMPSMTAIAGMAHKVQVSMREELSLSAFTVKAFALIMFNMDSSAYAPKRPAQEFSGNQAKMPSLMDIRRGTGEAALVLYVEVNDDAQYQQFCQWVDDTDGPVKSVIGAHVRFAKAEIFLDTQGEFGNRPLRLNFQMEWINALKKMKHAYPTKGLLIQDMSVLVREYAQQESLTTLEAMTQLLYESQVQFHQYDKNNREQATVGGDLLPVTIGRNDSILASDDHLQLPHIADDCIDDLFSIDPVIASDGDISSEDTDVGTGIISRYLGILLPCTVGFHEIIDPRNGHHFAESVLSLVRARILPSILKDLSDSRVPWHHHFWSWEQIPEHHLSLATTYQPLRHEVTQ